MSWSPLSDLGVPLPLVAAPMAGGPSSPELVAAVNGAGALGMVAGGYLSPDGLAERIAAARATGAPFGVNLFVPGPPLDAASRAAVDRYGSALAADLQALGAELGAVPEQDEDAYEDKLALLLEDPVPLVTTTFALPAADAVARLRRAGTQVWVTVTTPGEARAAEQAGATALVVQGPRAGGHSGTWDPHRTITEEPTADVLRTVAAATSLPLTAAGGVDGPEAVRELRAAGATAVAVGTLLLRTAEAGTSAIHRASLADPRFTTTRVTRAFTGRPARALHSRFVEAHDAEAPTAYPAIHHLTKPLRTAAAAQGDAERVHLWAGTGYRAAREVPAATVIEELARDL